MSETSMECLFDSCDTFVRFLLNRAWLAESPDKHQALRKALQWAQFTEAMHARLAAEDKLEEFAQSYAQWRSSVGLAPLHFANFEGACDELTRVIILRHVDDAALVRATLDAHHEQCGPERTTALLRRLSAESLLLKLFANFVCDPANYEDTSTRERLSKAVWYDAMLRLLPEEVARNEVGWMDELMDQRVGVETLIFLAILREPRLEQLQAAVMDRFQQNLSAEEGDQILGAFWLNFVKCDSMLLVLLFKQYSDFFEEFFEFFLKFSALLTKESDEWTSPSWLQFDDVVKIIQLLTTCQDEGISSYVSHIIDSMAESPLWNDVTRKISEAP